MTKAHSIHDANFLAKITPLIVELLGEGGIASKLPGFTYNPIQLEYSKSVAAGFFNLDPNDSRTSINALQAATGTGKTIGYLVPLMLYSALSTKRVAVSTFTRQLQFQILHEDILLVTEWVAQLTGVRLTVARLLGLQSYVSESSCRDLLEALQADPDVALDEAIPFLEQLIGWLAESSDSIPTNSGVLADFLAEFNYETIPSVISPQLLAETDRHSAAYSRDAQRAKGVDVLIVNHALLAINAISSNQFLGDEKVIAVLVCDEADKLPDVADSLSAVDVSLFKAATELRDYSHSTGDDGFMKDFANLGTFLESIKPPGVNVISCSKLSSEAVSTITTYLRKITNSLGASVQERVLASSSYAVGAIRNNTHQHQHIVTLHAELTRFHAELSHGDSRSACVISWSPVKGFPSFRSAKTNAGRMYQRYLRGAFATEAEAPTDEVPDSRLTALLLTSATLATLGKIREQSFDVFLAELGIFRAPRKGSSTPIFNVRTDLLASYEPLSFGQMSFVLPDPRIGNPRVNDDDVYYTDSDWLHYIAGMIRSAHSRGKRTLVLTTSFVDTEVLGSHLHDLTPLLHAKSTTLAQLILQYKQNPNAILISPAAWEGVNLPGMVDELVIPKIPYSSFTTVEHEVRRIDLIARGHDETSAANILFGRVVTTAKRRLSQGIGRGIRSKTDVCTVWIGDPRFPLPGRILESLDDIILDAPARSRNGSFVDVVPQRFRSHFAKAPIFNKDTNALHAIT